MRGKAGRKYFVLIPVVYCCISCCHCIDVEQDVASFIVTLKCLIPGQLHSLFACRTVLMLKGTDLKLCKLNCVICSVPSLVLPSVSWCWVRGAHGCCSFGCQPLNSLSWTSLDHKLSLIVGNGLENTELFLWIFMCSTQHLTAGFAHVSDCEFFNVIPVMHD